MEKIYMANDRVSIFIEEDGVLLPIVNKLGMINLKPQIIDKKYIFEITDNIDEYLSEDTAEYMLNVLKILPEKIKDKTIINLDTVPKYMLKYIFNKCEKSEIIYFENIKGDRFMIDIYIDHINNVIYKTDMGKLDEKIAKEMADDGICWC